MPQKTVEFSRPFTTFGEWLKDAEESELNDPTGMALATATPAGVPSVRMVLLKGWGEDGFVFYTNFDSRKGEELAANASVALLFHWKSLRRQIRIEGVVEQVSDAEADAYFASRPRASQIGAWASKQSRQMEGRMEFEAAIAKYTAKFGVGEVPRPDYWSGYRVKPVAFEFWRDRKFRLHERLRYEQASSAENWDLSELYP
jgi:pyridoxamine 5'-phosphate oxidase